MEMFSSFRGDKHEFCLVVIKLKHVRSCPSFDITYTCMLSMLCMLSIFFFLMFLLVHPVSAFFYCMLFID